MWLLHSAVLALTVALAMPTLAADDRPVKSKVAPVYPEVAKRLKISGVVKVEATVDPDGKVTDVKTLSGCVALKTAAEDSVRKWRFVQSSGQSTVEVDVNFALSQ
jgi:TonB family protein